MKIKYNVSTIKWFLFFSLLCANLFLLVEVKSYKDLVVMIIWEVSFNFLVVASFVFGFFPEGLEVHWLECRDKRNMTLCISLKQAREIYSNIPAVKNIIDNLDKKDKIINKSFVL